MGRGSAGSQGSKGKSVQVQELEPKSQTSTLMLSLHCHLPHSQLCAPSTNCQDLWGWGTLSLQGCLCSSRHRLSEQGLWFCSSHLSLECTRCLAAAFRPWAGNGWDPAQHKPTQGQCAPLQWPCRTMMQKPWSSKNIISLTNSGTCLQKKFNS